MKRLVVDFTNSITQTSPVDRLIVTAILVERYDRLLMLAAQGELLDAMGEKIKDLKSTRSVTRRRPGGPSAEVAQDMATATQSWADESFPGLGVSLSLEP